jgi:hypothetical protein
MKPTKHLGNVKVTAPILNLLVSNPYMDKMPIKNVYPEWKGESIEELKQHRDNPYRLRIGTPVMDEKLKADHAFFIQSYLSYNPATRSIEKRELVPYRNVDRVYIGTQSLEEKTFREYSLFVNGVIMAKDLMTIDSRVSFTQTVKDLQQKVDLLTKEVTTLKLQLQKQTIYNQ